MDNWLFGYGSLMAPSSVLKTIGAQSHSRDFHVVELSGYSRSWGMAIPVQANSITSVNQSAVFLDLTKNDSSSCNGVLFRITPDEWSFFDQREKQYERINITESIVHRFPGAIFTYIGSSEFHKIPEDAVIFQNYYNIIEEALDHWGPKFRQQFIKTTQPSSLPIIGGDYKFLDSNQNKMTGK